MARHSGRGQTDLLERYNIRLEDATHEDRESLAQLYWSGRFHAWDCVSCGERCYWGDPENWDAFQGVLQLDFTSYPGATSTPAWLKARQCDDCRMHDVADLRDLNLTGIGEPHYWPEEE